MVALKRSPLAPKRFPNMLPVPGIDLATAATGLRYKGRPDFLVMRAKKAVATAGVFTRSLTPSAPVDWCKAHLHDGYGLAQAIVVNAGNANAFTGKMGANAAESVAEAAAARLGCAPGQVLLASTGVIGEPLDSRPLITALDDLSFHGSHWKSAATAISTTDTFPKGACAVAQIEGQKVVLAGIAKGSGMIQPDMATMLGFLYTNAALAPPVLKALLRDAVDHSFNRITVDSDTSTSDTVLMMATGEGAHYAPITEADDPRLEDFRAKLRILTLDLAHQIVRDGEGASKFVTVRVSGAETVDAATHVGFAIANSPLIKTALAGEDPNWGRIVMAVGKSGERADRDQLKIWIGDQLVAENGMRHPAYDEATAAAHMKGADIRLHVDLGVGKAEATVWTCDLTHGYISINADYRS
ncbi:arginine biosynthesis bifunctional protein ArgJ [Iodidimonas gelatinilytica]|uniref:Arginine biosynthesis bifunctional protein ArgJ n=1 Tax=Iodidimonas gelatinilytica TaxID=1236966 RepID=A0A5A7MRW5_9PROT|nr:bifunctional glutamate N-acetyltransferase/amino-acid acetyltransferase ArgJ [Iodidimonas gelatinilytica]GEQ98701.1 arginine biosynthesis bifunctional protein ArgJ [Iodidimonas gelatinilytica]